MQDCEPNQKDQPRFPADRAFVVQFQDESLSENGFPGRIEHLASGRTARFQTAEELLAFVAGTFACAGSASESAEK